MDELATHDQIRTIVRSVLTARFPKVEVLAINIRDDIDDDGDNVVKVTVVVQYKKEDFDAKDVPAFVRAVITKFHEASESRFPIFSFIAGSELGKTKPEAA